MGGKNSCSNRDGDIDLDGCVKMMRGFLVAYQLKIRQYYDTVTKEANTILRFHRVQHPD